MKKLILASAFLSIVTLTGALAEDTPSCGDVAKDKWMTEDAIKEKAKAAGLDVRQVKIEGSCYEVYGLNAKGEKIEALFNPGTGEQVGSEGAE